MNLTAKLDIHWLVGTIFASAFSRARSDRVLSLHDLAQRRPCSHQTKLGSDAAAADVYVRLAVQVAHRLARHHLHPFIN